jgi:heme/copper-type cytochrome/quinol oxidase subunit 4
VCLEQALMAEVAEKGHNLAAKIELLSMAVKLVGTSTRLQMEECHACQLLLSLMALAFLVCLFCFLFLDTGTSTRLQMEACSCFTFCFFLFLGVVFSWLDAGCLVRANYCTCL